jgi:hypothetical protein
MRPVRTAVAYAPATTAWRAKPVRFVILGPGRCGSELLVDLLRSQPGVVCDGEILKAVPRWPRAFVEARAQRAGYRGARYYGCKILTGELEQCTDEPARFMAALDGRGWHTIGLVRRDVLRQSLSWMWAVRRDRYHDRGRQTTPEPLMVAPQELITMMYLTEIANDLVARVVGAARRSRLLVYEDALRDADAQPRTIDTIMTGLGGRAVPGHSDLRPTSRAGSDDIAARIVNYEEVANAVRETKFAPLLDAAG